jgi:hypothetical protein
MHRRTESVVIYIALAILAAVAMALTYLRPNIPH